MRRFIDRIPTVAFLVAVAAFGMVTTWIWTAKSDAQRRCRIGCACFGWEDGYGVWHEGRCVSTFEYAEERRRFEESQRR